MSDDSWQDKWMERCNVSDRSIRIFVEKSSWSKQYYVIILNLCYHIEFEMVNTVLYNVQSSPTSSKTNFK